MSPSPLAFACRVALAPPSSSDKTADADRLVQRLAEMGMGDVSVPLNIIRRLPSELRSSHFEIRLVMGRRKDRLEILDIGHAGNGRIYGVAVDIGSTTIDGSLFDLETGKKIDEMGVENPQVKFGADVLTRVQLSMTGNFPVLAMTLTEGVNSLLQGLCVRNGISADDVFAVTIAGNTIVSHFFLGLDVNNIPLSPYIPAVSRSVFTSAMETGLDVNKSAVVYVFPNSGSYVGGDIISGLLFSGVHREERPSLFVDVGTNVEIALGCKDWILVGAGAAGPALEGGVASIGKKAEAGTISRVRIDSKSKEIEMDVISDTQPSGICGSGLIDLISGMFSAGIIDQAGRFTSQTGRIVERDGVKAYLLYESENKSLFLTENEVKNFLLSKAAMFSFLYVFVKAVGLAFSDIKRVFIAGALGCGINPESAVNIGLLPDIPRERFIPLGNSSLRGAEMLLLDRDLLREVDEIAARITYREMNEDAELMNILQGAMFIPHTDPSILRG